MEHPLRVAMRVRKHRAGEHAVDQPCSRPGACRDPLPFNGPVPSVPEAPGLAEATPRSTLRTLAHRAPLRPPGKPTAFHGSTGVCRSPG